MSYQESPESEAARRSEVARLALEAGAREVLLARYGLVYDTSELQEAFSVEGFAAPFVVVTRRSDGQRGSLSFQSNPRFYFDFQPA